LAAAEENIEVARAARLAQIFKEICDGIISYKGDYARPTSQIHSYLLLKHQEAVSQWFMPVILATWEAENGRIIV
jgi:hypothetical protein